MSAAQNKRVNLGDEKKVRDRDKALANEEANRQKALREIMSTELGRAWIWWLLGKSNMHGELAHFDGPIPTLRTYFAAGQRNIGIQVLADIHTTCPDLYAQAMKEANDAAER